MSASASPEMPAARSLVTTALIVSALRSASPADQPTGARAGVDAVAAGDDTADDRGGIAGCPLDQALASGGKVIGHSRRVQRQRIHVDDVEVGLFSYLDHTAIRESEQLRGVVGLFAHHVLQRQLLAPVAIA